MKIAFPTTDDQGLASPVFSHFGSAPHFIIVDSEDRSFASIGNTDLHHQHGQCQPLKALGGQKVDAVVVGGIGQGALNRLRESGVDVFRAVQGTVAENLDLLENGKLTAYDALFVCSGHENGDGCAHH
jgi:predicted Fe-Mo cluster-binding NifX family protein